MKRVLEIGQIVAGPTAGLMLADMGYEVIKIEKPGTGDVSRNLNGTSAGTFLYYNRGKKSVSLDIGKEHGKEILRGLIKNSTIIIENMAPGTMDKLGFSFEECKKINPDIIYLSLKGYMEGPYHGRKSLDYPIEIESGLAYMTGMKGKPMRMGASVVDMAAAIIGVSRILQFISENRSGFIEIGLFETAMFLAGQHIATYEIDNEDLPPLNEKNFAWGIYDYFLSADNKKIFIAVATDDQWKDFCRAFEMKNFTGNPDTETNAGRYAHRDTLIPEIQKVLLAMDYNTIKERLDFYNISYGVLNRPWDLLHDVHAEKYLLDTTYLNKDYKIPGMPFAEPGKHLAPTLGRDTESVLSEAGYTNEQIRAFKGEMII
jgi:crotonobetainyl-CoA:carnitine CoA-transferase CaiB-like acyl-CoA transferase